MTKQASALGRRRGRRCPACFRTPRCCIRAIMRRLPSSPAVVVFQHPGEKRDEGVLFGGAQRIEKSALRLAPDALQVAHEFASRRGQGDTVSAPIGDVGLASQQSARLEQVNMFDQVALVDAQTGSEIGLGQRPEIIERDEHGVVSQGEITGREFPLEQLAPVACDV